MAKICHMSSGHLPNDTRIFIKECRSLAKAFDKVYFVVPGTETKNHDGVELVGVPRRENRWRRFSQTAWDVFQAAKKIDADIYHFHDPDLIPYGVWLKKSGKKVIYDVHEDFPKQTMGRDYIPKVLRGAVARVVETAENNVVKRFDALVAATPFIARRMGDLHGTVVTVNNYPVSDELAWADTIETSTKDRAVCYVGAIGKNRGFIEMINAIGGTSGKLNLVGDLSEGLRSEGSNQKGWSHVNAIGRLNRSEVARVMAKSSAGLVLFHPEPNHIDAQPTKLFEYLSAGLPVIASNFPLWAEIIEKNGCGICVDPLNSEAIAKSIEWIFTHPQEAAAMGERGRSLVANELNWHNEEKKLIHLYEELLGS